MRNKYFAKWTRSVYISNLNWNTEEWHLDEYFQDCGEILNIYIFRDDEGRSRGQAIIEFLYRGSQQRALYKDQQEFLGRQITVMMKKAPVRGPRD